MRLNVPILAFVSLAALCFQARVDGQVHDRANSERSPGVVHNGRFLGFVPAHLRAGSRLSTIPSPLADEPNEPVQTAEFVSDANEQPEQSAEELAVPGAVVAVEDAEGLGPVFDESIAGPSADWFAPAWATSCYWGRAEYLLWWTSGMDVPPLATTSPNGTAMNQAGVLGQPGTTILFGGDGLNDQLRPGGRVTLGRWLDSGRGLEASYLNLGGKTSNFSASNNGFPILARPFFNVQSNAEDARRIAFPGEGSGTLDIQAETDFQAFEALYRVSPMNVRGQTMNFLVGYRFAELEDRVGLREFTTALSGPIAGTTFDLTDNFDTRNTFHGGQLGIVMACQTSAGWSWEAVAKVALGNTNSRGSVFGQTTTTAGGVSTTTQAGLLAQSTNIGTFEQDSFSTVSEFEITVRRQLDCGVSLLCGYTFLYWSDVTRAGDQIDLGVNTSQIPPGMLTGSARPAFPFDKTGFWAQGLRLGVEYAY